MDDRAVRSVRIGDRTVGNGHPCVVIAEAGVNHDGRLEQALALVDAAADARADAVKFQTWQTELLVAASAPLAEYQRPHSGGVETQAALLKRLELTHDEFRSIAERAAERGVVFLSTPDEEASADFLEDLGVVAFKIASAEVSNVPFLRHVAAKGRPVILSTGMSSLDEVAQAVRTLEAAGASELVLLQCTSAYPTEPGDANLLAMRELEDFGYPVGYSDHTLGIEVALAAVALGAAVVEKHLTLDRTLAGPDHAASLEPAELAALVRGVRRVEAALGDGAKRVLDVERPNRSVMRKVFVAARDLAPGDRIAASDLVLRRSHAGTTPDRAGSILGRVVRVAVVAGEPVSGEVLE